MAGQGFLCQSPNHSLLQHMNQDLSEERLLKFAMSKLRLLPIPTNFPQRVKAKVKQLSSADWYGCLSTRPYSFSILHSSITETWTLNSKQLAGAWRGLQAILQINDLIETCLMYNIEGGADQLCYSQRGNMMSLTTDLLHCESAFLWRTEKIQGRRAAGKDSTILWAVMLNVCSLGKSGGKNSCI